MMKTKKLVHLLTKKGYTISFGESCTGGLLAAKLISVNNSSKVIKESYVTYAEQSKIKILGVNEETLSTYTVYSKEVAIEMAKGVSIISDSTLGIGVTGIAGPLGGTKDKPVGTIYFAIFNKITNETKVFNKVFKIRIRNHIRKAATKFIIAEILKSIK